MRLWEALVGVFCITVLGVMCWLFFQAVYVPPVTITCEELRKEAVALERCHDRYNCTLTPEDFRYGIQIWDLEQEMECEWEEGEGTTQGIGDLQAGEGSVRRGTDPVHGRVREHETPLDES